MNLRELRAFYNTKPVEFVIREKYELKEDNQRLGNIKRKSKDLSSPFRRVNK